MSLIEPAVNARLKALTGVTALVGARIYLDELPQDPAYPCVSFATVSTLPAPVTHDQYVGLITTRVQITAWGQSPKAALELAHEVLKGFAGYRGTVGGVTIQGVFHAGGPGLLYDPADVVKTYYCPHDFYFHYALPA